MSHLTAAMAFGRRSRSQQEGITNIPLLLLVLSSAPIPPTAQKELEARGKRVFLYGPDRSLRAQRKAHWRMGLQGRMENIQPKHPEDYA